MLRYASYNAIYKARLMYGAISRAVRRKLGIMPIHRVLQELADRQVKVADAVALEVFAGTGDFLTRDLAAAVSSMEAWEVDEAKCEMLARRLSGVKVRAVDSIKEIYNCTS